MFHIQPEDGHYQAPKHVAVDTLQSSLSSYVFCNGVMLCCAAPAAKHCLQWRRFHSTIGECSSVERCCAMLTGQYLTDISVD